MKFTNYVAADTPQEALALLGEGRSRIVGGNLWLRMSNLSGKTMIDLKKLGWDKIEEQADSYVIGAGVTLRQLETHPGLNEMTGGLFAKALRDIVGVQFRNAATVGGSLYMRAGFSDVLTMLLPLDGRVLLYPPDMEIPLQLYAEFRPGRELVRGIRVPKQPLRISYQSVRNTSGNVPVLTCCCCRKDGKLQAAIGARPHRAVMLESLTGEKLAQKADALDYGTNAAASGAYRRHLAKVLLARCLQEIEEEAGE